MLELPTTQLETVLQTVDTLIQNNSDIAQLDTSHTKQVLCQLKERLNSGATTQATAPPRQNTVRTHGPTQKKKTYAEASSPMKHPEGPPRKNHVKTTARLVLNLLPIETPTLASSS